MIRRLAPFVIGLGLGAALMYLGLLYHVLRADDGFHLIPKSKAGLADTYVDIRGFELQDWQEHTDLAIAISTSGKTDLLTGNVLQNIERTGRDLWEEFKP